MPRDIQVRNVNSAYKSCTLRATPRKPSSTLSRQGSGGASSKVRRHWVSLQENQPSRGFWGHLGDGQTSVSQPVDPLKLCSVISHYNIFSPAFGDYPASVKHSQPSFSPNTRTWIFRIEIILNNYLTFLLFF